MLPNTRTLMLAAVGAIASSAAAHAAGDPTGIWIDHNNRAAVEISPCADGNGLCGYVVHIIQQQYASRCGLQILFNVTPNGGGRIYSPDRGKKYSVELTRLSDDKLKVVGNAGSFFSKTYTWKRAPDTVARCGETTAAAPAPETPAKAVETAAASPEPARDADREPASTRSLGAPSGAMALMGAPKKRRVAEAKPETLTDASPAPAEPITPEPVAAKAPEKTAATAPAPREEVEEESSAPERKCKFKIPYVGRVISVPCRD